MEEFGAICKLILQVLALGMGLAVAGYLAPRANPELPTTGEEFTDSHPDFPERSQYLG